MAGIVVVLDFDETIIDCDSDNWVVDEMGVTNIFNELLPTMPWNSLMDRMMNEIHSKDKTIEEISACLKRVPLHPQIVAAIRSAYALGCDLRIVSDANIFFIETILKHHGVFDCFSEINSNPCTIDEDGRLRIFPYNDSTISPHGCNLCPQNMCKGLIIEQIRASISPELKKRFIYVGDGKGDICPSMKLKEGDYLMPRKHFTLWSLISSNPTVVKTEVHEWSNAEEFERILIQLITTISTEENNSIQSATAIDCKPRSLTISSNEALPQALPVPH